jgi:hypothetical protein
MRLMPDVDNEACLAWLDRALEYALETRKLELYAYLEVVMEDVLFETAS